MENTFNLLEEISNTLKYELYSSKPPDEQSIERYKKYITTKIPSDCHQFNLTPHPKQNLCSGSLKFDQNIEEEWFIVYILYKLSEFDRDLVIRVYDNDGDILLIEAAEHLPLWLESSKSKSRVFIHNGKLHIIPEEINLKELQSNYGTSLSLNQVAARFIRDMNDPATVIGHSSQSCNVQKSRVKTLASSKVQEAIKEQLCGMPDKQAWLSKKFKQLDDIISHNSGDEILHKKFKESLTLASVVAMDDDDLRTSPIGSARSSSSSSSSSWLTEQEDD